MVLIFDVMIPLSCSKKTPLPDKSFVLITDKVRNFVK